MFHTIEHAIPHLTKRKVLIVVDRMDENLYLSARNVPSIGVNEATGVNPVQLLKYDHVLMTVDALRKLEETLR